MRSTLVLALWATVTLACNHADCEAFLERIRLPEGFEIEYYARDINNARSLVLSPTNILYVGTRNAGNVYAVVDRNGDGRGEVIVVASGLNAPNGLAFRDGTLFVAEISRLLKFPNIDAIIWEGAKPEYEVIRDDLPKETHHGNRYMTFRDNDPNLYMGIGAPCNTCYLEEYFGTIVAIDLERAPTAPLRIVATGVRDTLGIVPHPITNELWFTDNGRDQWGNDIPPDELNVMREENLHYGFPFCHGTDLVDEDYNKEGNCHAYEPNVQPLGPHVAALGMRFHSGSSFPEKYRFTAFIAEHGSWNRDTPIGYRVTTVRLQGDHRTPVEGKESYEVFADGWLPDNARTGSQAWGRPVDVIEEKDGSILISDDKNNAIYRVRYVGNSTEVVIDDDGLVGIIDMPENTVTNMLRHYASYILIGAGAALVILSTIVLIGLVIIRRSPDHVATEDVTPLMSEYDH